MRMDNWMGHLWSGLVVYGGGSDWDILKSRETNQGDWIEGCCGNPR